LKPYYQDKYATIFHGDCLELLPGMPKVDLVLTDPPYGVTSLSWDKRVDGWLELLNSDCLWCFGSMRFFIHQPLVDWKYAQEIVWEKHNGSIFHADRFRRVHEFIVQFYRGDWEKIYKKTVFTKDATARTVRRKKRPAHSGNINASSYKSFDGGPKIMRSVIYSKSCHGYAVHPTQKPVNIIIPIVEYSCPENGSILDPFMGSGTILVAAKQKECKATGIEIEERDCEIAAQRLNQEVLDFGSSTT